MRTLDNIYPNLRNQKSSSLSTVKDLLSVDGLLILVLFVELFSPILIWKGILPGSIRWISDIALVIIIGMVYIRMMVLDRVPGAMWVIIGFSLIGVTVALYGGQSIFATVWGLWLMFRYPFVGIYTYLQPSWPVGFPQRLRNFCTYILTIVVAVQIGQYMAGEPLGDNLAGIFGKNGTGPLLMYIFFVLCLALGKWLASDQWKPVFWVLLLGIISSVLGVMKFFLPSALALLALGITAFIVKGGQPRKLAFYVTLISALFWAFIIGYNTFVPEAKKRPIEAFVTDAEMRNSYLLHVESSSVNPGGMDIGRNYALKLGWDTMSSNPVTFLFGRGLGALGESRSLGMTGIAFELYGRNIPRRSSLFVLMQEMGFLGLSGMAVFILWVGVVLLRDIRHDPNSQLTELRYALLLFSLFWPLWLWYHTIWDFGVTMLLYWGSLGYVLGKSKRSRDSVRQPAEVISPFRTVRKTNHAL